jgi:hypothetical protein
VQFHVGMVELSRYPVVVSAKACRYSIHRYIVICADCLSVKLYARLSMLRSNVIYHLFITVQSNLAFEPLRYLMVFG